MSLIKQSTMLKVIFFWVLVSSATINFQVACKENHEPPEKIERTLLLSALAAQSALMNANRPLISGFYPVGFPGIPAARPAATQPPPTQPPPVQPPTEPPQVLELPVVQDELGNFYYEQIMPNGAIQYVYLPPQFIQNPQSIRALVKIMEDLRKLNATPPTPPTPPAPPSNVLTIRQPTISTPTTPSRPIIAPATPNENRKPTLLSMPNPSITDEPTNGRPTPLEPKRPNLLETTQSQAAPSSSQTMSNTPRPNLLSKTEPTPSGQESANVVKRPNLLTTTEPKLTNEEKPKDVAEDQLPHNAETIINQENVEKEKLKEAVRQALLKRNEASKPAVRH